MNINTLASADLFSLIEQVDTADQVREAMLDVVPSVVDTYGSAAAANAADFYDDLREAGGARGRFTAVPAQLVPREQSQALARWAAGPMFAEVPDKAAVFTKVAGGASRLIGNMDRTTITGSAMADPADPWVSRVASSSSCEFCQRIAGFGAYYAHGELVADYGYHDHCKCVAVPSWQSAQQPQPVTDDDVPSAAEAAAATQMRTATTAPPAPTGRMDAAQYEALRPGSAWTQEQKDAITAELMRTENGKVLADSLEKFQDGGSISRMRTSIERYLAGESQNPTSQARAEAIVDMLRHAPTDWAPPTLYRGMSVKGSLKNVLAKYQRGERLDLNLTSFSADRKVATKFQQMTAKKGSTRVMVELIDENKRAVPIQNFARDRRLFKEKEWISGGRYEVVEAKQSAGAVLVRIKQTETL